MKKVFILVVSLVLVSFKSYSQQDPYFSTYLVNPTIVNSSLSSLYENNNVILVYRNQWANYNPNNLAVSSDSPNTGILSLNLKSRDKNLSFGMNVVSDNLGPKEFFNFSPYFSLRKKLNN